MQIKVLTIFPEMFEIVKNFGVISKAFKDEKIFLDCINIRDFAEDKHKKVDDKTFGGGAGQVMKIEPLAKALKYAKNDLDSVKVIYLSPQGEVLTQRKVISLSQEKNIIFINGRYEGVDERFIEKYVDEEISVGDYVLSGGELATMIVVDALARCIPGVIGNLESVENDSFSNNLLDYPHYTKPVEFEDMQVPSVLLSGNHQKIQDWRLEMSLKRTLQRKPELLESCSLSGKAQEILNNLLTTLKQDS